MDLQTAFNSRTKKGLGTSKLWAKKIIPSRNSGNQVSRCAHVYVDEFQIVLVENHSPSDEPSGCYYLSSITLNRLIDIEPHQCACMPFDDRSLIDRFCQSVTQKICHIL